MKTFKLLCLLGVLSVSSTFTAKNTINIKGVDYGVDTVVYKHNIGPGTTYAFYNLPERPLTLHVMEVDMTNPYVDIETCLAGDSAVATRTTSGMYADNDRPGHDMIGATNGDFWQYVDPIEIGIPRSGQFRQNECVANPTGRASFILSEDRLGYIDVVDFRGTLTCGETSHRIHTVNTQRLEWEDTKGDLMILYTNSYGKYTHKTSGGTKAIIRPKSGNLFFSANENIECVVESVFDNPGVSPIPENSAVLYGVGPASDYLKTLKAGDNVTVFLKTDMRKQPGFLKNFREQIGGSNEFVLLDGEPVGDQEAQHPRTAIGVSKDKKKLFFVVIDGRQPDISQGASIYTIGSCLKFLGAYEGVNLDGGGSTCMVVNKDIKNSPSDGKERAVGNGMLIYSNAPVDDEIAILEFMERPYVIPISVQFRPIIRAFNKYGVLKSKDLAEVKLTCDPQIGTITDNNVFIATDKVAEGYITATYKGISVKRKVKTSIAPLSLVYDKYLIDNLHTVPIEMQSIIGITVDKVDPNSIIWQVENPEVCRVDRGCITGLQNGSTKVVGASENFTGAVNVTVENPVAGNMPVIYPSFPSEVAIKQTGGTGIKMTEFEKGFKLTYTGNGASRGANISINQPMTIWGLPESVRIKVNPGDATIKRISMSAENALGERIGAWEFTNSPVPGKAESSYELKIDWCDISNVAVYPITINALRFDMGASKKGQEFAIEVPSFEAIYPLYGGISSSIIAPDNANVYPNPVNAGEAFSVDVEGNAVVDVYSLNGQKVLTANVDGPTSFTTEGMTAGIYFVTVKNDNGVKTAKLIVK